MQGQGHQLSPSPCSKERVQELILVYTMCFWKNVYYTVCQHYSRDPVECMDAQQRDLRCEDWEADDKEMESQTANGTPYIKAVADICMDCRYEKMRRKAANKKSRRGPEGEASGSKTKT
jgi:hypothetical protein